MASATAPRPSNDENCCIPQSDSKTIPAASLIASTHIPTRRVLGDVSPNVKAAPVAPGMSPKDGKPLTGSPLKRSFAAMMEQGHGFTYLKKRAKLLVDANSVMEETRRLTPDCGETSPDDLDTLRFRPLLKETEDSLTEPNTPSSSRSSPTSTSTTTTTNNNIPHATLLTTKAHTSFSSLINYDSSSQQQHSTNLILSSSPKSKAELLRLRLKVAMYKIRTHQIHVPFADLRLEPSDFTSKAAVSEAVERAVAELKKEAMFVGASSQPQLQQRQGHHEQQQKWSGQTACPKLLPAPVLKPTAYSSRMLYAPPPHSLVTPPSQRMMVRRRQLSSPPDSAEKMVRKEEADLTSSGVKGRVAEGLLGLRHAG